MERFLIDSPAVDQAQVANTRLRNWIDRYTPELEHQLDLERMPPAIEEELIQALSEARLIVPVCGDEEE